MFSFSKYYQVGQYKTLKIIAFVLVSVNKGSNKLQIQSFCYILGNLPTYLYVIKKWQDPAKTHSTLLYRPFPSEMKWTASAALII